MPSIRRAALLAVAALVSCAGDADHASSGAPLARRNVVVMLVDTLRADVLSTYGHPRELAPFLTRVADEGAVFEHALSASSWTAPATASIFTSLYPDHHGVITGYLKVKDQMDGDLLNRIPDGAETLAEMFRRHGYRTVGLIDNPTLTENMGFGRGFDVFESSPYRGARYLEQRIAQLAPSLEESEQPYFLYVHWMDPHKPYNRHKEWFQEPPAGATRAERQRAAYESEVAFLDRHIERVFEKLALDRDSTLVLLLADHGEEFGEHGNIGHPPQLYDELTRVPWIAWGPEDLVRPQRIGANVSTLDLLPTLAELLGEPQGALHEGVSLASVLAGAESAQQRVLFSMRTREYATPELELRAALDGERKMIVDQLDPEPELYDLGADPAETDNLADTEGETLQALQQALELHLGRPLQLERSFFSLSDNNRVELDQLERLGYVGD